MWRTLVIVFVWFLFIGRLAGQVQYSGNIDKYPITLVAEFFSDQDIHAIYEYKSHHDPIEMNGKIEGKTLTLYEKDKAGKNTARFTFPAFSKKSSNVTGTWTNLKNNKELTISLVKDFDIEEDNQSLGWKDREIIQSVALKNNYFRVIIGKKNIADEPKVTGVKIFDKKTGQLVQQINLDCGLSGGGLNSIEAGDYNFDGFEDFSVFETSYAGPNTSSLYFLYNPQTGQFFNSGFKGVSLDFDNDTKTITENNQCCGGNTSTTKKYKVVNNKMILTEQHCYIFDEKKQDMVEHPMKDCE
jgi:hypothetical protein